MLRKIRIEELAVGMYVVETGLSWLENPYLYSQEGEVRSLEAIREIARGGFEEVFIDTERGAFGKARAAVDKGQAEALAAAPDGAGPPRSEPAPAVKVPLDTELAVAVGIYNDYLAIARDILQQVKAGGAVDVAASRAMVNEVISSAVRNRDALIALGKLRVHDAYTFTHGVNVSVLAVAFGASLGIAPTGLRELGLAGLFHDLGKTGVPDAILNKPGRLTPAEFARIREHPTLGRRLLAGYGLPEAVLRGVAEHHEKSDGSGYPLGVCGDKVHPWGRILGVADVFDALTSRRSYKEAMLPTRALAVLYGMRGRDFPAETVERFIKFLGPYPVGSFVRLTSGAYAFVRGSNPSRPLFPELLVVLGPDRRPVRPGLVDLEARSGEGLAIAEALDPDAFGLDPLRYLSRPVT